MKLHLIPLVIMAVLVVHAHNRKLFQIGNTEYVIRFTNVTNCPHSNNDPFFFDIKLNTYGNSQYMNGKLQIAHDYCLKWTWNVSDFCMFFKMKNSMWQPFHSAIRPSTWSKNCPCFKKVTINDILENDLTGFLELNNGTFSVKEIISFYPDADKYYWQIWSQIYDRKDAMEECLYLEFHISSYNPKIPASP